MTPRAGSRRAADDFDINNVVGAAPTGAKFVERAQHADISTPSVRPAPAREGTNPGTKPNPNPSGGTVEKGDGGESDTSSEDTSDEAYVRRHAKLEIAERAARTLPDKRDKRGAANPGAGGGDKTREGGSGLGGGRPPPPPPPPPRRPRRRRASARNGRTGRTRRRRCRPRWTPRTTPGRGSIPPPSPGDGSRAAAGGSRRAARGEETGRAADPGGESAKRPKGTPVDSTHIRRTSASNEIKMASAVSSIRRHPSTRSTALRRCCPRLRVVSSLHATRPVRPSVGP